MPRHPAATAAAAAAPRAAARCRGVGGTARERRGRRHRLFLSCFVPTNSEEPFTISLLLEKI
jgi:hypothetical protein